MWLICAFMVFYIPNAPLIKWVEKKNTNKKNKQSWWTFGARQHKLRQEHSDKPWVYSRDSSASALFEQPVSLSSFYHKLIYLLYYRSLFCDLTCEILVWLESNSLMNRWHLISGVQINIKYVSIWFKTLLHKLMDFLQQEVNICYPDGIRLTKFIMLTYHKSGCQSLRKLKDKYTVVLTSYLHTFMNYQKMNCCLKTNIILFKVAMLQKVFSRWISVQNGQISVGKFSTI